jgi:hypothetical protein
VSYEAESLLLESGLFWCVMDGAGRLQQAFYGDGAEDKARSLADILNGGDHERDDRPGAA